MPQHIARYRALAARMRAIAEQSTEAATKTELLALADRFERLASYRERKLNRANGSDD